MERRGGRTSATKPQRSLVLCCSKPESPSWSHSASWWCPTYSFGDSKALRDVQGEVWFEWPCCSPHCVCGGKGLWGRSVCSLNLCHTQILSFCRQQTQVGPFADRHEVRGASGQNGLAEQPAERAAQAPLQQPRRAERWVLGLGPRSPSPATGRDPNFFCASKELREQLA